MYAFMPPTPHTFSPSPVPHLSTPLIPHTLPHTPSVHVFLLFSYNVTTYHKSSSIFSTYQTSYMMPYFLTLTLTLLLSTLPLEASVHNPSSPCFPMCRGTEGVNCFVYPESCTLPMLILKSECICSNCSSKHSYLLSMSPSRPRLF